MTANVPAIGRERSSIYFYADWPLGYANQEAERKARHFARQGYDVVYVTGAGVRNPRLQSAGKLADRAVRSVRERGARPRTDSGPDAVRATTLSVLPPRQVSAIRRSNARWVKRQLRATVPDWSRSVAWIRTATPELVDALPRVGPAATVYEAVDAHHQGSGIEGVWKGIFEDAERRLVEQADLVVVTSASLAARFEDWGATVRHVGHGVDLFPWRPREPRKHPVLGFVGVLDFRVDTAVVRHIARARPTWTIRLVGPVEPGFDPSSVADLPNVRVEPPVPHDRVGDTLAELDLGLMAYADYPSYRHGTPLKNLELLAAGRPGVARPTAALAPYERLIYLASTPDEFVQACERALDEDDARLAAERRAVAEANAWPARLAELSDIVDQLLSGNLEARGSTRAEVQGLS